MTRGAPGGRGPSQSAGQWQAVTKRDNGHIDITAGQDPVDVGQKKRPQQDSNLRSRLRRPLLSPLSYGGSAPGKGYQPKPSHEHVVGRAGGLEGSSR